MRTFKKKRNVRLDYYQQGFVYFICSQYRKLPAGMKGKIDRVCREVGGFDEAALRRLLLDMTATARSVSLEYNLSEGRLNVMRDEFYWRFYHEVLK